MNRCAHSRSEERRVGKECRSLCDWSSDVCSSDLQKISQEVRALTNKRGADVVIENVGEATWDESLRSLGRGGRLVSCGATTGPKVGFDMRRLFWYQWSIMGSTMGNDAEYREIVRRLGAGELRPIVDRVFPFTEARAAFERLERGEQLGKIAIEIPE